MTLIIFIKHKIIFITSICVFIIVIFLIYNAATDFTVDMKLYKQLYDKYIITEYIKNKHLDLTIGNKF